MIRSSMATRTNIVVVDDDEDVRRSLEATLASAGYDVACYATAEALLAAPSDPCCACLVSDVQMPGMGGIELTRRLKVERPNLPVILISAFASKTMRRCADDAGARYFFEKPFDSEELLRTVGRLTSG